jgi:hypothetical protein
LRLGQGESWKVVLEKVGGLEGTDKSGSYTRDICTARVRERHESKEWPLPPELVLKEAAKIYIA